MDPSGLSFAACRRAVRRAVRRCDGRLRRCAALCALAGTLSGCSSGGQNFLTPDGPVAAAQYQHLRLVVLIMLVVVVPVLLGVPLLAWRYRAGNTRARYLPEWDFSTALEWPMWLVPTAVLIALSVLLWRNTQRLDPYRPIASARAPLTVEVVGLDWKWLFIYPEYHIATVGELAFPQDRSLALRLTSDTVMQSFMIPALGGQIYAMPGMVTQLHLAAARTGRFGGLNTQYDGRGFHAEQFAAVAMRPGAFARWIAQVERSGVPLGPQTYRMLGRDSTPRQVHAEFPEPAAPGEVTYFRGVAPGTFRAILERYRRGTPIPRSDQPGTAAYDAAVAAARGLPR